MMSSSTVPLLDDDDTLAFGEEDDLTSKNAVTHPYVTFFHLFFRGAAIASYMLCGWFSDSFIVSFVVVVMILSMDFWTVKNITGRLMVGLRWWNYVDDDGKSHWVFESRKNRINDKEASIFWLALVLTPLVWAVFFIIALFGFKLKWLLLVTIALILNGSNLYGYVKCKVGQQQSLTSATSDFFQKKVLQNAMSVVVGKQTQPTVHATHSPVMNTV